MSSTREGGAATNIPHSFFVRLLILRNATQHYIAFEMSKKYIAHLNTWTFIKSLKLKASVRPCTQLRVHAKHMHIRAHPHKSSARKNVQDSERCGGSSRPTVALIVSNTQPAVQWVNSTVPRYFWWWWWLSQIPAIEQKPLEGGCQDIPKVTRVRLFQTPPSSSIEKRQNKPLSSWRKVLPKCPSLDGE